MDGLEALREELWKRWQKAFDRWGEISATPQTGLRAIYARAPLFNLKGYTPSRFPAGGRVLSMTPETGSSFWTYWLDDKGRPIRSTCRHPANHFDWQGLFQYSDEEVEHIEFCVQTEVASGYARMTLRNGLPATYQRIEIDGGGSHLGGRRGKDAIAAIAGNSHFYWMHVEEYESEDGRIVRGRASFEGKGLSPQLSALDYRYAANGKLMQVVRINKDGSRFTEFAARSKSSVKALAAKLSEKIASSTMEALKNSGLDSPLQAIELSYRSVTEYLPGVIAATERDAIANLCLVLAIAPARWITLQNEDFEPEMAEFTARLGETEQWDGGSKMLRRAALLVTKLVPGALPTAEGFVAFAIDWECEGNDLKSILKQCGASPATLKKLAKKGWLE